MPEVVLVEANPALLFKGVNDPGFDGAPIREVDPYGKHLSVFDLGFIRGDGIFEATSVVGGVPLAMKLHIARLGRSARLQDLPELTGEQEWLDVCQAAIDLWGQPEETGTIRLLISRGADPVTTVGQAGHPGTPTIFIFVDTVRTPRPLTLTGTLLTRGYSLELVRTAPERHPWLLIGAKTLSYTANMATYREAVRRGADFGIYTSTDGYVLEGGTSSLVLMKDGKLTTPIPDVGILHGTTQQEVFAYAERRGVPHEYAFVTVEELLDADFVWNMGGSRLSAVERIDDVSFAADTEFAAQAMAFFETERAYIEEYTTGPGIQRWL
ncbi:aminotransferase class IV [Microbacterium paludicola]|nr:aminotransferase class IV [Microbacterium paludicola]MBF0817186.1 aminotransferase class IV [Microbacterium paludicola]